MKHIEIGQNGIPYLMVKESNKLKVIAEENYFNEIETMTFGYGDFPRAEYSIKVIESHKAAIAEGGKYAGLTNPHSFTLDLKPTGVKLTSDEIANKLCQE
mgnify:FL=1